MAKVNRKQTRKRGLKSKQSKEKQVQNREAQPSLNLDTIPNFINLCTKFEMHLVEYRKTWKVAIEDCLIFYKIDTTSQVKIVVSIKVEKTMQVRAFTEHGEADRKYLTFLLNQDHLLQSWSQLKNVLQYFSSESIACNRSIRRCLSMASFHLQECLEKDELKVDESDLKSKLEFIYSQIHVLTEGKFTDQLLSLAYMIYLHSSICYRHLQGMKSISLPMKKDLIAYAATID